MIATLDHAFAHLVVALLVLLLAPPAAAQTPLESQHLAAWMGLQVGDELAYETSDGDTLRVEVGSTRTIGERSYATLQGLSWPGLASDSQILIPLDGAIEIDVIRTPGPRPSVAPLYGPGENGFEFLAETTPEMLLGGPIRDGWYAFGGSADDPDTILHVWCSACFDAGSVVRFERGRGIVRVDNITIAGPQWIQRVATRCRGGNGRSTRKCGCRS
ncbi:MAG: hypothetical protein P8Y29_01640 [Gemmatimonadota bacterium]|jgi:hypothetical protein